MHERINFVSPEDLEVIQDAKYALHTLGLLVTIRREGYTLDEALNAALAESNEEGYQKALRTAKEFLEKNAEMFGLE